LVSPELEEVDFCDHASFGGENGTSIFLSHASIQMSGSNRGDFF